MKVILAFFFWSIVGIYGMSEDDRGGIDGKSSFDVSSNYSNG